MIFFFISFYFLLPYTMDLIKTCSETVTKNRVAAVKTYKRAIIEITELLCDWF